jgi:glyoxylase-like metal-dependent hydrolase (beta-lactamase superfamily II)
LENSNARQYKIRKIGDEQQMKMYVLDNGCMYLDESMLVAGAHAATLRNQSPPAQWVDIPVHSFLIELDGGGYLLYDTGCHVAQAAIAGDSPSPFVYEPDQLVAERLKQLSAGPDDVKYVVMSHLHTDHAGYLYLFNQAEIIVSDAEFGQSMKLYGQRKLRGPYLHSDFDAFLKARLNWKLIEPDAREYPVCKGVTAVNFGSGHTFGMTGMLVELPNSGNFLMCSDALYRSENLGPPTRLPTLIYDSVGYVKSADFIAQYAKAHSAKILFGHDKAQFKTLKKSTEGYYD